MGKIKKKKKNTFKFYANLLKNFIFNCSIYITLSKNFRITYWLICLSIFNKKNYKENDLGKIPNKIWIKRKLHNKTYCKVFSKTCVVTVPSHKTCVVTVLCLVYEDIP